MGDTSAHISSDGGCWWQAECVGDEKRPLRLRFERRRGAESVGDKQNPSAHVSSDGGVSGRQRVWVTKEDTSARISSDGGGWWQAENVGDEKRPLRPRFEQWKGFSGRQRVWVKKRNPSAHVSSDGGD